MIDYICVGLVACYLTYHTNKCAFSKKDEQTNGSNSVFKLLK